MSLIRLSQIRRDINIPRVWREEYYNSTFADTLLVATTTPGTLISVSTTVTLTETSLIRVNAKCAFLAADNVQYWGNLYLYEGVGGATALRDQNYATCNAGASSPAAMRNGCSVLWIGSYAAGPWVFEIRARGSVANKVTVMYNKMSIDVCRV